MPAYFNPQSYFDSKYSSGATNSGSATSNPYTNPNSNPWGGSNAGSVGGYSPPGGYTDNYNPGYGGPPGWVNPNAGSAQYAGGMFPTAAGWQGGGYGNVPGHQGQSVTYNPYTGESDYLNNTSGLVIGHTNTGTGGPGTVSYIDPETGMKTINMSYLMRELGNLGLTGNEGYDPAQVTYSGGDAWSPSEINIPGAYGGYDYQQSPVDPSEVIASTQPLIDKQMNDRFAAAGNRAGKSGWAMSTGYTGDLGESAKWASDQNASLIAGLQYDAAKLASDQFQQQQLQAAANDFGAWSTHGGWDVNSQIAAQQLAYQKWARDQELKMQADLFNAGAQNQANSQNSSYDQQIMQQILGGVLGGGLF